MRMVIIGASTLGLATARKMLSAEHEVVVIDSDETEIEYLSDKYDCSFVHGDGTKPSVLKDVDPGNTDVLFCVTDNDTANILSAVVARSMDFDRVVLRIESAEMEAVCEQLELTNIIIPDDRIANELLDFAEGRREEPENPQSR